jgi:hypothetical protein
MLTVTVGSEWSSWRITVIPFGSFETVFGMATSSACARPDPRKHDREHDKDRAATAHRTFMGAYVTAVSLTRKV